MSVTLYLPLCDSLYLFSLPLSLPLSASLACSRLSLFLCSLAVPLYCFSPTSLRRCIAPLAAFPCYVAIAWTAPCSLYVFHVFSHSPASSNTPCGQPCRRSSFLQTPDITTPFVGTDCHPPVFYLTSIIRKRVAISRKQPTRESVSDIHSLGAYPSPPPLTAFSSESYGPTTLLHETTPCSRLSIDCR